MVGMEVDWAAEVVGVEDGIEGKAAVPGDRGVLRVIPLRDIKVLGLDLRLEGEVCIY